MLSILRSTAVINEQNFNLLSSGHVNVGFFFTSLLLKPPPHVSYWLPGIIITGLTRRILFCSILHLAQVGLQLKKLKLKPSV